MESENFRTIEATGKSVDEAIFRGLQELGISIDEVTIEIIRQETKGVLGIGAKPAIVKLIQRPPEEFDLPDYLKPESKEKRSSERTYGRKDRKREVRDPREKRDVKEVREPREKKEKKPVREELPIVKTAPVETEIKSVEKVSAAPSASGKTAFVSAEPVVSVPTFDADVELVAETASVPVEAEVKVTAPVREHKPNRDRNRSGKPRRNNSGENRRNDPPAVETPEINYTAEAADGNPAAEFVNGLLKHMGVTGNVLAAADSESLHIRIDGDTMGVLIGRRGETLDAMQYLTSLVVNRSRKSDGYMRVTLDTEDYREKREETLRRLAKRVAHQVRSTGRPRVLEPMNPYERRILHSALQSNPFVSTHSEGDEPNRRVVVTPKRRSRQQ